MYRQSARVYDALCRQKDHAAASFALREILQRIVPHARSLLDVGCGTGLHLQYLREHFHVEGLDLSGEMLEFARQRCPGVPFHEGNLVDFQLATRFDVIACLFGSIAYCETVDNLQRAVRCMAGHLELGGALVIEPWIKPDRFVAGKLVFDSVDEPDLKVARMYVTRREGLASIFDINYLVAAMDTVTHFTERHKLGLFTDEEYRRAFSGAGLDLVDASEDLFGYGLYVCRVHSRPLSTSSS